MADRINLNRKVDSAIYLIHGLERFVTIKLKQFDTYNIVPSIGTQVALAVALN